MPCPLCILENRTKVYYEDQFCSVRDCDTCTTADAEDHVMIVLKRHTVLPAKPEEKHMRAVAHKLGLEITRRRGRKIREHCHYHAKWAKEASPSG